MCVAKSICDIVLTHISLWHRFSTASLSIAYTVASHAMGIYWTLNGTIANRLFFFRLDAVDIDSFLLICQHIPHAFRVLNAKTIFKWRIASSATRHLPTEKCIHSMHTKSAQIMAMTVFCFCFLPNRTPQRWMFKCDSFHSFIVLIENAWKYFDTFDVALFSWRNEKNMEKIQLSDNDVNGFRLFQMKHEIQKWLLLFVKCSVVDFSAGNRKKKTEDQTNKFHWRIVNGAHAQHIGILVADRLIWQR